MRKGLEDSIRNWRARARSLDIQIESMEAEHRANRLCIECGAGPLVEGYYMGDVQEPHYRCNEHPIAGWPKQYVDGGENYWTTWDD